MTDDTVLLDLDAYVDKSIKEKEIKCERILGFNLKVQNKVDSLEWLNLENELNEFKKKEKEYSEIQDLLDRNKQKIKKAKEENKTVSKDELHPIDPNDVTVLANSIKIHLEKACFLVLSRLNPKLEKDDFKKFTFSQLKNLFTSIVQFIQTGFLERGPGKSPAKKSLATSESA